MSVEPARAVILPQSTSGSFSASSLQLNGTARSLHDDLRGGWVSGSASGTIGFDVTASALFTFSWANDVGKQNAASLKITASDGSVVLGCVANASFTNPTALGGCAPGAVPTSNHGPLELSGQVTLASGHYILDFGLSAGYFVGTADNKSLSFNLAAPPVPLPPALWLLVSGFASVATFARRRRLVR